MDYIKEELIKAGCDISKLPDDIIVAIRNAYKRTSNDTRYRKWTADEEEVLRKYYPIEGSNVYKRLNGRTKAACMSQANRLGINTVRQVRQNAWTEEENSIMRKYYPIEGPDIYKRLNERTKNACKTQANKLGIKSNTTWTEEEIEILRKYYPGEGYNVYKRLNGKTKNACIIQAGKLGIKSNTTWTEEEIEILRKYYQSEGPDVYKRLNGRTRRSCITQANRLGITTGKRNPWSEEENAVLRDYYPGEGRAVCKRLKGRTKSACALQAGKLGIKYLAHN